MATLVEKDVLYPGTVHPPGRNSVTFTTEDAPTGVTAKGELSVPFLARRAKEMLGASLQIPVAWEHQSAAKPMTKDEWDRFKAEKTQLTVGQLAEADLHPDGFVTTKFNVEDDDLKKLPKIRFVSPEIAFDVKDGTGKIWPGPSITHIAVTPRPVQHKQQPFKPIGVGHPPLQLSFADYRLSADDEGDGKGKGGESGAKTEPDPADKLKKVIEVLTRIGLVLGDDVTSANLVERLYPAALTYEAANDPSGTAQDTSGTEGTVVTMSLDDREKRIAAAEKRLVDAERGGLKKRAQAFVGFLTKPELDDLLSRIDKEPLQLSLDGKLERSAAVVEVEAYEKALKKAGGNSFNLSLGDGQVVEPPDDMQGSPESPADVDKAVDSFFATTGTRK